MKKLWLATTALTPKPYLPAFSGQSYWFWCLSMGHWPTIRAFFEET